MKLRIHAAAEQEARQAAQWYEDRRVGLGFEFLAAVDTALQRIGDDPLQFPVLETLPDEPSVRRFLLKRFPYTIIYEVCFAGDPSSGRRSRSPPPAILEKTTLAQAHTALRTKQVLLPPKPKELETATRTGCGLA